MNPNGLRNQMMGAVTMAIGGALFEAIQFKDGRILNPHFSQYRVPRFSDTPEIDVVMLENPYPGGPFGAKGLGELPMDGPAPAVVNALRNYGLDVREVPAPPEHLSTCPLL